jgi:hypothetical protein
MTALAADRNTPRRDGVRFRHPLAAGVRTFAGGIAVLDASGNVKPAATATGLIAAGIFTEAVDNRSGQAGDLSVNVEKGIFGFASDGSLTRAHIGHDVFLVDDQTVAATDGSGTRSTAGRLSDFDGTTAFVHFA